MFLLHSCLDSKVVGKVKTPLLTFRAIGKQPRLRPMRGTMHYECKETLATPVGCRDPLLPDGSYAPNGRENSRPNIINGRKL